MNSRDRKVTCFILGHILMISKYVRSRGYVRSSRYMRPLIEEESVEMPPS